MNKQKVYLALVTKDYPLQIRKGSLDLDIHAVDCRPGFLRERQVFTVPEGVGPYPYKKKNMLYFVDVVNKVCVGLGSTTGVISADNEAKVDLYSRNKFWRFVGGRALGIIEMLIYLAAGYGAFKLVEILITSIWK